MKPKPQRAATRRPAPPGGVEVAEIRDPTATGGSLESLDQDMVQLEASALRARRLVVRLEDCLVVFHATNLRMRVRTTLRDGLAAFSVFGPGTAGTLNGAAVRPDQMLTVSAGDCVDIVAEPGYESVAILVPPALVRSQIAGAGRLDAPAREGAGFLAVLAPRSRDLFAWGKRLAELAAKHPARFAPGGAAPAAAKATLLHLLRAALDAARPPPYGRRDRTLRGHSRLVRLAEAYAVAQLGDQLYVEDLCGALGVSERTLEYAFAKILRMSPVAFLRRLRLHRVRQALQAATRGSTTVSIEALNGGFSHFGEFSRAYRDCFGELPSETLRRSAEVAGRAPGSRAPPATWPSRSSGPPRRPPCRRPPGRPGPSRRSRPAPS